MEKTTYPTLEMANFLYPKIKELQEEYFEEKECINDDDYEFDFSKEDYHQKYKIRFHELYYLRDKFLMRFSTELIEIGRYDIEEIFYKAIEMALDRFFTPEIYVINDKI